MATVTWGVQLQGLEKLEAEQQERPRRLWRSQRLTPAEGDYHDRAVSPRDPEEISKLESDEGLLGPLEVTAPDGRTFLFRLENRYGFGVLTDPHKWVGKVLMLEAATGLRVAPGVDCTQVLSTAMDLRREAGNKHGLAITKVLLRLSANWFEPVIRAVTEQADPLSEEIEDLLIAYLHESTSELPAGRGRMTWRQVGERVFGPNRKNAADLALERYRSYRERNSTSQAAKKGVSESSEGR